MNNFNNFLLYTLHKIFSFFEFLIKICSLIIFKIQPKTTLDEDVTQIRSIVSKLSKTPHHVAVLLDTENIRYDNIAKFVIWCKATGISYLSLFDVTGAIKDAGADFYNILYSLKKEYTKDMNWNDSETNGHKNGQSKHMHINVFSKDDDRFTKNDLVRLAKQFSVNNEGDKINVDFIDDNLFKLYKIPDPELSIITSKITCTYGFMNWNIRLTEFHHLDLYRDISADSYINILKNYSKCEQRIGK